MKPEIKIFKNTSEIAEEFANTIQQLIDASHGNKVHIALSGGSTPKHIFAYLTEHYGSTLAKTQLHFWWGDDRCVPPTDDESNYKWANELWLNPIGIQQENIHRVKGEDSPDVEVLRYSTEIANNLPIENGIPVFDLMLLGLGEDGHTASIFPHQMKLLQSESICEVATHPESGQKRITLTGKVINQSKVITFLATGENKALKVKEIIIDRNKTLPAANVTNLNGQLIWWLDVAAARLIN